MCIEIGNPEFAIGHPQAFSQLFHCCHRPFPMADPHRPGCHFNPELPLRPIQDISIAGEFRATPFQEGRYAFSIVPRLHGLIRPTDSIVIETLGMAYGQLRKALMVAV